MPPLGRSAGRYNEPEGPPPHPQERDLLAADGRPRQSRTGQSDPAQPNSRHPRSGQLGNAPLAAVRAQLGRLDAAVRPQATALVGRVQPSLQAWFGRDARAAVAASLATVSLMAIARYVVVFLAGVVAAVVWRSPSSEPRLQPVAVIPADIGQVRDSIDRLSAEVSRMRTVEMGILERVSAPPPPPPAPPAAVPARNTQRPPAPTR